jgi:hypothetical protein
VKKTAKARLADSGDLALAELALGEGQPQDGKPRSL